MVKSPSPQPFDRFCWILARWSKLAPTGDRPLKFRIFQKPRWRRPQSWKSEKSRYLLNGLTNLYEIWHHYAKWVSWPSWPLKNLNLENPRWRTAANLEKTVKSSYLSNRWTDFDEIWHGDASLPATGDRPLKFGIFQKTRWRRSPSWKTTKNRDITTTNWPIFAKFGTIIQNGSLKMAAAAIVKITKIAISPQWFDLSLRNLAPLCNRVS